MPARKSLLSFSLLALAATPLHAAPITWGQPTDVSAETDVSTNGTSAEAVNASARTSFSDRTVNGVEFVGGSILPLGGFNGDFDPNAASELSGTYQQLLNDCDFGGGTTTTIEIGDNSLMAGLSYEVQVWFLDTRNTTPRVMTYSDESAEAAEVDLDGRAGQFAVGTFVADGTSQTLKISANVGNAHLNAFQVRLLTPVHEVTTLEDEFDTPSGDDLSLREAIRDAAAGDLIVFHDSLDGGLIELDAQKGQLVINKSLTIAASALADGIIIDGGSNGDFVDDANETRCFLIDDRRPFNLEEVSFNKLTVQNGVFEGRFAGGNIHNAENLTLTHCQILNGRTFGGADDDGEEAFGGGIYHQDGNLTMTACTVSGNQTQGEFAKGGGVCNLGSGSLTMTACTVSDNQTQGQEADGGGIFSRGGALTMNACTVSGNQTLGTEADGGGVFHDREISNETARLTRCTISGNTALHADGGGFFNSRGLTIIEHCTIVENSAGNGAGISSDNDATTEISHSIIQNNLVGSDLALQDSGAGNSYQLTGENLIGTVGAGVIIGIPLNTGPILLAPLANYGGPTETMPPLPDSPAIDAALTSDADRDQRDFRTGSFLDGPVELVPSPSSNATVAKGISVGDAFPDIGAAEFQGESRELELAFDTDGDGDGLSVGLELFIGSDPFVMDFDNPNRPRLDTVNGATTITFGRAPNLLFTTIIVERSETLLPGSFQGVALVDSFHSGEMSLIAKGIAEPSVDVQINPDSVVITDNTPPDRAFYRLGASREVN